jgi:putative transcriptional regulator
MEELLRQWGQNIKRGRGLLRLTQAQLGDLCGVTRNAVSLWESGDRAPTDVHKIRIAEALHQDVRQLFPLIRRPEVEVA